MRYTSVPVSETAKKLSPLTTVAIPSTTGTAAPVGSNPSTSKGAANRVPLLFMNSRCPEELYRGNLPPVTSFTSPVSTSTAWILKPSGPRVANTTPLPPGSTSGYRWKMSPAPVSTSVTISDEPPPAGTLLKPAPRPL